MQFHRSILAAVVWLSVDTNLCCNMPNISPNETHVLQNYSWKMLGSRENSMGGSEDDQLSGSWDRWKRSLICLWPALQSLWSGHWHSGPISSTKLSSTQQSRLTQCMLSSLHHSQGLRCSPGLGSKLELLVVKNPQLEATPGHQLVNTGIVDQDGVLSSKRTQWSYGMENRNVFSLVQS